MARSGGFEPPTAWFVARYSIQLSYERAMFRYQHCQYQDSDHMKENLKSGASWRIRTSDRLVRSQVLYPAELRTHILFFIWMLTQMSKNGGEGGIRTLDAATNHILP